MPIEWVGNWDIAEWLITPWNLNATFIGHISAR